MSANFQFLLASLIINDTAKQDRQKKEPISGVLALTWCQPNFGTQAITATPIRVGGLVAKKSYKFPDLLGNQRIVLKGIADGSSYIQASFTSMQQATLIDKFVTALLSTATAAVNGINPWIGAAMGVVLADADFSKDKLVQLGSGAVDINPNSSGTIKFALQTPGDIHIVGDLDPRNDFLPYTRTIAKGTANGELTLSLS